VKQGKNFVLLIVFDRAGLLDIAEALRFLHNDARLCHGAVSPFSIFIDIRGRWLLGGLGHCFHCVSSSDYHDVRYSFETRSGNKTVSHDPPLCYAAPETISSWPGNKNFTPFLQGRSGYPPMFFLLLL
jgi:hypothetical protein